jgi:hypothetical protein
VRVLQEEEEEEEEEEEKEEKTKFHFHAQEMTNYSRTVVLLSILEMSQEFAWRLEC